MNQAILLGRLAPLGEPSNARFSLKLKISEREILGVRTPHLTRLAKEFAKQEDLAFLDEFLLYPSVCYEEVILAFKVFGLLKLDRSTTLAYLEKLLPYNDSWATNDALSSSFVAPKKDLAGYWPSIIGYLDSPNPWDIRFATITLMCCYLTDLYTPMVLNLLAAIRSDHYYVNMGIAWVFATAMAKQRDLTLGYLKKGILPEEVRKKAIQKSIESFRVSDGDKAVLRSMR